MAIPAADNLPFTSFPTDFATLPTVCFVVPDLQHDMHDGSIATPNAWLKDNLDSYVQWAQTHNSLFILTFDEDDTSHANQITTLFVGPMVVPGSYGESINHFNVLRTVEEMYGLPYAGASATATPITDVWRAPATASLVVGVPSRTTAGGAFSIIVTVQDASGKPAAAYTGTVHFTSSDARAILPADYTFTAADAGVHTFLGGATLKTAGLQSIAAKDRATSGLTGSPSGVTVAPAAASRLVISGPTTVSAGVPFSDTVTALDPYGNRATGYAGTVQLTRPPTHPRVVRGKVIGKPVLLADYTFTAADAGMHVFTSTVPLNTKGTQSVTVADTGSPGLTATLAGIVVQRRRRTARVLAVSATDLRHFIRTGALARRPREGD